MNLTNFHYPMFSTTDREKEILRMIEIDIASSTYFIGVCGRIHNLEYQTKISFRDSFNLGRKIRESLNNKMFLDDDLVGIYSSRSHAQRNLMRRIWITKLLNYKG